jgi:hypothetical protein
MNQSLGEKLLHDVALEMPIDKALQMLAQLEAQVASSPDGEEMRGLVARFWEACESSRERSLKRLRSLWVNSQGQWDLSQMGLLSSLLLALPPQAVELFQPWFLEVGQDNLVTALCKLWNGPPAERSRLELEAMRLWCQALESKDEAETD